MYTIDPVLAAKIRAHHNNLGITLTHLSADPARFGFQLFGPEPEEKGFDLWTEVHPSNSGCNRSSILLVIRAVLEQCLVVGVKAPEEPQAFIEQVMAVLRTESEVFTAKLTPPPLYYYHHTADPTRQSPGFAAFDIPLPGTASNVAQIVLTDPYPAIGWTSNTICDMTVIIADGTVEYQQEGEPPQRLKPKSVVFVARGKKYRWLKPNVRMYAFSTPPWTPEQQQLFFEE